MSRQCWRTIQDPYVRAPLEAAPDQPAPRSLPDRILLDIERPIARLQFAGAGIWYPQFARPSGQVADGLCFGSRLLRIIGQVENLNSPVAENCDYRRLPCRRRYDVFEAAFFG